MLLVRFNTNGYYIKGDGVDIIQRCSPASTDRGDNIFQPIHHTYKVLFIALSNLIDKDFNGDAMVYNDTRIIDELNSNIEPLDEVCAAWVKIIKRDIIPRIKPLMFFRKKNVDAEIAVAQEQLVNPSEIYDLIPEVQNSQKTRKSKIIQKFKENWNANRTQK